MENRPMKKRLLQGLTLIFGLMALATAIPFDGAREASILGYKSLCPFMPISTVIALYLAITTHRYLRSTKRQS